MDSISLYSVVGSVLILLLGIISLFFILRLGLRLLKSIFKGVFGRTSLFKKSPAIRLLALAAVSLFFPKTVSLFVRETFYLLLNTYNAITSAIWQVWGNSAYHYNRDFNIFTTEFLNFFRTIGNSLNGVLQVFFSNVNIGRVVWLVGLWIAFCYLLQMIRNYLRGEQSIFDISFFNKTSKSRPYSIFAVAFILLFGTYLGLTSVIAIPWLRDPGTEDTYAEQLSDFIENAQISQEEIDLQFPHDYGTNSDPFQSITSIYNLKEKLLETSNGQKIQLTKGDTVLLSLTDVIDKAVKGQQEERALLLQEWNTFIKKMKQSLQTLSKRCVSSFKINTLEHMAEREKAIYLRNTLDWYSYNTRKITQSMSETKNILDTIDILWKNWSQQLAEYLTDLVEDYSNSNKSLPTENISRLYADIPKMDFSNLPYYGKYFQIPREIEYMPNPPEPGSGWGTLGIMSRWLLKTRSFDLVLIIGMVGFGLIGSVIGLFIPVKGGQESTPQPQQEGINFRKILRGFYAAVILFLSVQAGSEIFLNGDYRANPYTLFWFCLVGAAFGEIVWERALKQLLKKLGTNDQ